MSARIPDVEIRSSPLSHSVSLPSVDTPPQRPLTRARTRARGNPGRPADAETCGGEWSIAVSLFSRLSCLSTSLAG
jgi:hypothetical protein